MKKVLQSILAPIISTLVLFAILETGCWILGFPTGASRYNETILIRENLTPRKSDGEFRIFVYGESTIHGSHYWKYSNPAIWLREYLKDFVPDRNVRIVNFARMGQGAYRTFKSVSETLQYHPDLILVYTGHNGFLPGNRRDEILNDESKLSERLKVFFRNSRLISAMIRLGNSRRLERGKDESDIVGSETIEAGPSGIGAENAIPLGSPRYQENVAFFRDNLDSIRKAAESKKIPIIFYKPAGNLKDFPPSCSQNLKKLSAEQAAQWKQLYETGKVSQVSAQWDAAQKKFEEAAALDDTHADLLFRLGHIYLKKGDLAKAKEMFVKARDYDCIIVRAPTDIIQIVENLPRSEKLAVIETENLLAGEAPGGILGYPIVEDNVHFSIKGHAILGRAAAQAIAEQNWFLPFSEWDIENERSFEEISRAIGVTPDLVFESYLQCVSYFGSKYDNRIFFAQKALEIKPEDPRALRHLAWSYWIKGDAQKAVETYRRLEKAEPEQLKEIFQKNPGIQEAYENNAGFEKPL